MFSTPVNTTETNAIQSISRLVDESGGTHPPVAKTLIPAKAAKISVELQVVPKKSVSSMPAADIPYVVTSICLVDNGSSNISARNLVDIGILRLVR